MSVDMRTDAEYQRLWRLHADAKARGDLEAATAYGGAVIRRGDEILAELGSEARFTPMWEAAEEIRRLAAKVLP